MNLRQSFVFFLKVGVYGLKTPIRYFQYDYHTHRLELVDNSYFFCLLLPVVGRGRVTGTPEINFGEMPST